MTLPVTPMQTPTDLKSQPNGRIDLSLLQPCGVPNLTNLAVKRDWYMHHLAARAMKALVVAWGKPELVRATGTYRTYEQQVSLFTARYQITPIPGRPTKFWQGKTWWQKPGVAMAAVPGTSNHGLGLAIDFAEERDGDIEVESISQVFVNWLCIHAIKYGYSAEAQSEPWHWRYVAGDAVPKAVLDFEVKPEPPKPPVPPKVLGDEMPFTVKVTGFTAAFLRHNDGTLTWIQANEAGAIFGKFGSPVVVASWDELAKLGTIVGTNPGQV